MVDRGQKLVDVGEKYLGGGRKPIDRVEKWFSGGRKRADMVERGLKLVEMIEKWSGVGRKFFKMVRKLVVKNSLENGRVVGETGVTWPTGLDDPPPTFFTKLLLWTKLICQNVNNQQR